VASGLNLEACFLNKLKDKSKGLVIETHAFANRRHVMPHPKTEPQKKQDEKK